MLQIQRKSISAYLISQHSAAARQTRVAVAAPTWLSDRMQIAAAPITQVQSRYWTALSPEGWRLAASGLRQAQLEAKNVGGRESIWRSLVFGYIAGDASFRTRVWYRADGEIGCLQKSG